MASPRLGHIELAKRIFGYLSKYPKRGYAINPQPLTIASDYENVQMKYDFGNQYVHFSEEIDDQSYEPLLDELDIHVFVDANHGHNKITVRLISGLFSVVVSTPTA